MIFSVNSLKVKKMKRTVFSLLLITLCSSFAFSSNARNEIKDDLEDKIALSRDGGTTRITNNGRMSTLQSEIVETDVEAYKDNNFIIIYVRNYIGSVSVEIEGRKASKKCFFDVFDYNIGNEFVVQLNNGISAGTYTIQISLDNGEVFTGTFTKGKNGHNKK